MRGLEISIGTGGLELRCFLAYFLQAEGCGRRAGDECSSMQLDVSFMEARSEMVASSARKGIDVESAASPKHDCVPV